MIEKSDWDEIQSRCKQGIEHCWATVSQTVHSELEHKLEKVQQIRNINRVKKLERGVINYTNDRKRRPYVFLTILLLIWLFTISVARIGNASTGKFKLRSSSIVYEGSKEKGICADHSNSLGQYEGPWESLSTILCHERQTCGTKHFESMSACDKHWQRALQTGNIDSINLLNKGPTLETSIKNNLDNLGSGPPLYFDSVLALGHHGVMYPINPNKKSVVRRNGFTIPDGTFIAYKVQGKGGGSTYAYYVDKVLQFNIVPPAAMRLISSTQLEHLFVTSARKEIRKMKNQSRKKEIYEMVERFAAETINKYAFNESHTLVEMVASIPPDVAFHVVPFQNSSPMISVDKRDTYFWDFVTFQRKDYFEIKSPTWIKMALDIIDLQIFDYLVGNDDRMHGHIGFAGTNNPFLVAGNNTFAGSSTDKAPKIKMPAGLTGSNLYLGVIGCRFRKETVLKLTDFNTDTVHLSTKVRNMLASHDPMYVEHHRKLAHGWLMATLDQVDLLYKKDLDDNLVSILKHVSKCLSNYPEVDVLLDY